MVLCVYEVASKKKETTHEGDKIVGRETMGDCEVSILSTFQEKNIGLLDISPEGYRDHFSKFLPSLGFLNSFR